MSTNGEFPGAASIFGVWRGRLGALIAPNEAKPSAAPPAPVPLADDQRLPLYLQAEGAKLQLDSGVLRLTRDDDEVATAPLAEVSDVVLIGPVIVTTPCLHALLRADIPVSWHTMAAGSSATPRVSASAGSAFGWRSIGRAAMALTRSGSPGRWLPPRSAGSG